MRGEEQSAAPGIGETLDALGEGLRGSARSALASGLALRELVAADLALARGALARTLVFAGVAVALGGSSWLLLMAACVAGLHSLGLAWLPALLLAAALSIAGTYLAARTAMRYFEHTRLDATRRQLARLLPPPSASSTAADPP